MEQNADDKADFSKLKVPELKKELKSRHLSTAGNKTELMERLLNYVKNKRDNGTTVDDLEEDLLNDEDDDHLDNDEHDALLTDLEKTISESAKDSKPQKRKSDKLAADATKPKKVTLTRKSSTSSKETAPRILHETSEVDVVKSAVVTPPGAANGTTKKLIKFSDLSVQERLEMRSKKFGTPLSADAAKQTRTERFAANSDTNKQIIAGEGVASVDVLKQRAKRFGVSVAPSIAKLENLERLERRKSRFGAGATVTVDTAKVARLERFK